MNGVVGGMDGIEKTLRGRWNKVGEHSHEDCVWDEKYHDGKVTLYLSRN